MKILFVEVDATQIEQVVAALMLNAREAMPRGGIVRICARNFEIKDEPGALLPAGRYLKITIADRGPGIPEELVSNIFDPYFTTKIAASGLGLAISYSIVKKHGGLLHLESTSTEVLGVCLFPSRDDRTRQRTTDRPKSRAFRFNHQRILVMDDEAAIRELTSQLLGTWVTK